VSVTFAVAAEDCLLQWVSTSGLTNASGLFIFPWQSQFAGQPIAWSIVSTDGQPIQQLNVNVHGSNLIDNFGAGASAIYTTANLPYVQAFEQWQISGLVGIILANVNVTFNVLIRRD